MTIEKDFAMMKLSGVLAFIICLSGCQTLESNPKPARAETISALATMTQGLTNQPVTHEQLKNLAVQAAKDPKAQSAIRSINTALSAQRTVKYCPVDGQRFNDNVDICPIHHVKLKWVE